MPKSSPAAPVNQVEEKWKQQVRLACVQAVCTRAVASATVYDAGLIIGSAKALANFVLQGD